MTDPLDPPDLPAPPGDATPPGDPDEERRYRATRDLDGANPEAVATLLGRLNDPSWRVRNAAAERLARCEPARVVPGLVAATVCAPGPGGRGGAAGALVLIGAPAVPALVAALASSSVELRTAASEILGEVADPRAVSALAQLLEDPEPNVRIAAADAIGKTGGPRAVAALQACLARADGPLRRSALEGLLRLKAPPPAARLAELVADKALRRPALRLAGLSDDPAVAPLLAQGLTDAARTVRAAALSGLGQRQLSGAGPLPGAMAAVRDALRRAPEAVEATAAALADEDVPVRAGAVAVLSWVGAARHAPALAEVAQDERLRTLAAEALGSFGAAAAEALRPALPSLTPIARVLGAAALARLGEAAALVTVTEALTSDDEAARETAFEAVARLGDPRAVPALLGLLDDEDPARSGSALAALSELAARTAARGAVLDACRSRPPPMPPAWYRLLGRIGEADDAALLRVGLKASHRGTRVAAAAALAALGERTKVAPVVPPELLVALDDQEPAVRAAAAQALGTLGQAPVAWGADWAEATRALAMALRDEEPGVRAAAALALGRCGAEPYAGALAELAADSAAPAETTVAAVHALTQLGAADARILAAAARHPDPEVVKEAVRAASSLPGAPMAELLVAAAGHPRWDVRRAAAAALADRGDRALLDAVRRLLAAEQDPLVAEALRATERTLEGRP